MFFLIVLDDGHLFKSVALQGTFRLAVGQTLRIIITAGHALAFPQPSLELTTGDGKMTTLSFSMDNLGGGFCDWTPSVAGPASIAIRNEKTHGPISTVVVQSNLIINGKHIPHQSLCLASVISQRLGHISRWPQVLRIISRQKFNALHFTPLQPVGVSKSSYSLRDVLSIEPSIATSWDELKTHLDQEIRQKLGLLAVSDLVLNHMSSDSPWLTQHPDAGYNERNCPWLQGAIELDLAIKRFNAEIVEGKWSSRYNATKLVRNENDLGCVLRAFNDQCLSKFNLHEFFKINMAGCKESLRKGQALLSDGGSPRHKIDDDFVYEECLKLLGISRSGITLGPSTVVKIASQESDLERLLSRVQSRLDGRKDEVFRSIIQSFEGTIRYERIQSQKGPVDCTPWNSLVPWYFTPIQSWSGSDSTTLHLANNGWVMNWDNSKDFAAPGALVYLSRTLVAWSDCVKLRYGAGPQDSPALWSLMTEYCEKTAQVFDGIRLDNCHSTPLHVGKYLLSKARAVHPNLFVFAELFTGCAESDETYERELGLDALVREAIQTGSPGDLAWHCIKYGDRRLGRLHVSEPIPPMYKVGEGMQQLTPRKVMSLFYDCTHDNETLYQKNRVQDSLACAAMVCASTGAVGSTLGYEILAEKNPSVMADGRLYKVYPCADEVEKASLEGDSTLTAVRWQGKARRVGIRGSFDNWKDLLDLESADGEKWHVTLPPSVKLPITFKFVVDDQWLVSPKYSVARDQHGNENNVLSDEVETVETADLSASAGIVEGRRVLNAVHQEMQLGSYDEIEVQWASSDLTVIERHSQLTATAYYFIVRSHWWTGGDRPETNVVHIKGNVEAEILNARVKWNQSRAGNDSKEITGIADTKSCLIPGPLVNRRYDSWNDLTELDLTFFPCGSVLVLRTKVRRPEPELVRVLERPEIVSCLSLDDVNKILWSCDREERDRSGGRRGVYLFPNSRTPVEYAGLAGVLQAIEATKMSHEEEESPYVVNVREGNWWIEYQQTRFNELLPESARSFKDLFNEGAQHLKSSLPHRDLRPAALSFFITRLFTKIRDHALEKMHVLGKDPLVQQLALASTQVIGTVPSSSPFENVNCTSFSAGLPHFTVEYMREWGRDTFLGLPGCALATHRWEDAKREIMAYARVLRHAMLPNLLDSGNNPRYNARDVVWYWFQCLRQYTLHCPQGESILKEPVELKYPTGLEYDVPTPTDITQLIHNILSCHQRGIKYREWNAGKKIDEHMVDEGFNVSIQWDPDTGFCLGGNRHNCGTWMDKMGSSSKAGNKGQPATPRDGAPVELTAILWATLRWIVKDLMPAGLWPYERTLDLGGRLGIRYEDWFQLVSSNFEKKFLVTEDDSRKFPDHAVPGSIKDLYRCSRPEEDFHLRSNYPYALGAAFGIVSKETALKALDLAFERLMGEPNQVGMKTLDPKNPNYRPNYRNDDDSTDKSVAHGWNYHNGPEWVWPFGGWLLARYLYGGATDAANLHYCMSLLKNVRRWITKAPWWSLPELMDRDGHYCRDSCQSQLWSIGTILYCLYVADEKMSKCKKQRNSEAISASVPVQGEASPNDRNTASGSAASSMAVAVAVAVNESDLLEAKECGRLVVGESQAVVCGNEVCVKTSNEADLETNAPPSSPQEESH